jgi:UDP-N-acetylmuramate dehydrogenase
LELPFIILGGGSNVLVSDAGVRGVVVMNRARRVDFDDAAEISSPSVWAESGANFGLLARQAASRGLGGLEWAAGIPGTVGGAVVGNAGAHGGDTAGQLSVANILHLSGKGSSVAATREEWPNERLGFAYRTSTLKKNRSESERYIVLAARLQLFRSSPEAVQAKLDEFVAFRRRTQPPGASMGSMFKNPPGDYAGRLIEAAGLKGERVGDAEINRLHANFFLNHGKARAEDVLALIRTAQSKVEDRLGVRLELEVELIGEGFDL